MIFSSKIRVAVLRGGPSDNYDTSLRTGGHVLATLRDMPETYEPLDIFISKRGEWHREGLAHKPHRALQYADVVWNALHGVYGEDGQVQRVLEGLQIPFNGSSAVASALTMNQDMAKRLYQRHNLPTPAYEIFTEDSFNELKEFIKKALTFSPRVLVEEFIKGKDATCTVIEDAREEKIYALLPASSHRGEAGKLIEKMAKQAHKVLGLSHYSSSDFIITPKKKIYILKTSISPELHEDSLTYHSLCATGWRSRDFVDHIIKLAM